MKRGVTMDTPIVKIDWLSARLRNAMHNSDITTLREANDKIDMLRKSVKSHTAYGPYSVPNFGKGSLAELQSAIALVSGVPTPDKRAKTASANAVKNLRKAHAVLLMAEKQFKNAGVSHNDILKVIESLEKVIKAEARS